MVASGTFLDLSTFIKTTYQDVSAKMYGVMAGVEIIKGFCDSSVEKLKLLNRINSWNNALMGFFRGMLHKASASLQHQQQRHVFQRGGTELLTDWLHWATFRCEHVLLWEQGVAGKEQWIFTLSRLLLEMVNKAELLNSSAPSLDPGCWFDNAFCANNMTLVPQRPADVFDTVVWARRKTASLTGLDDFCCSFWKEYLNWNNIKAITTCVGVYFPCKQL